MIKIPKHGKCLGIWLICVCVLYFNTLLLLYFFLRDALAVDGVPGEDDVGEHERDEEETIAMVRSVNSLLQLLASERTLKVDVGWIVGGIVPAGYQQQNQHGKHGSDARKPDSLSILHAPR